MPLFFRIAIVLAAVHVTMGHLAAFHKGMYCLNGPVKGVVNVNTNNIVRPLYELTKREWWFHHVDNCDQFPPQGGDILELPAGGEFTVEIADNRAQTSLSFDGKYTSEWADGKNYPDGYNVPTCIVSPNMHTQNESMAAGTAFAISYESDITKVTAENLVVFSVKYHTPWKRLTTYSVPEAMPPCPAGGCICGWGWIPNGCGQPNMYHVPYRCNVTGSTSHTPVAAGVPPVWCEGDPSACVKGAKQMLYWNQRDGNNIEVSGYDLSGGHKSPGYNTKCGFSNGAQNDIFESSPGSGGGSPAEVSTPTHTPTHTPIHTPAHTPTPTPTHHTSPNGTCSKRRRSLEKRVVVPRGHRRRLKL